MDCETNIIKKSKKNIKFTFISQILVLILSVLKSLILPNVLTIPDYGYWQVYVLYSTYVGIFALGYNDGIYLKYGKYNYDELPAKLIRKSNLIYFSVLLFFSFISFLLVCFINNYERKIALYFVCFDIFFVGIIGLLIYILQITNQIKAYSFYSVLDKIILLVFIIILCFLPKRNYKVIILADVISKIIVAICLCIKCKSIIFGRSVTFSVGVKEFLLNIRIGINLMIANLMGMFINGFGRFLVETFGDIESYAYYSFGNTITNLVLVFITSVSLVLYPTLKRLPTDNYSKYFHKLNYGVNLFNSFAILLYFPSVIFVHIFYNKYTPLIPYLQFLFGVVIMDAKMQLINNTFYKVLRKEKLLLYVNLVCATFFVSVSTVLFIIFRNVYIIALCTFIAMLFRCYFSHFFLKKQLQLKYCKNDIYDILYVIIVILVITFLNYVAALIVSICCLILYLVVNIDFIKKGN